MLLQAVDNDPVHLIVAECPGGEADGARNWVASARHDAVDAAIDFFFGLRMVAMRGLRADDVDELNAFRSGSLGHHISGLFLLIDLATIGDSRAIEEVEGIVGGIVPMPDLLLVPGWLYRFLLEDFQKISRLGKAGTGSGCGPHSGVMDGDVPTGGAA